jgi:hypothetical protein
MKRLTLFLITLATLAGAQVCPPGRGPMLLAQNTRSTPGPEQTSIASKVIASRPDATPQEADSGKEISVIDGQTGQLAQAAVAGHIMKDGKLDPNARPNIIIILSDDVGVFKSILLQPRNARRPHAEHRPDRGRRVPHDR